MIWGHAAAAIRAFDDGLGVRRLETDADGRAVEVLEVASGLAAHEHFEMEVRTSIARLERAGLDGISRVRRVERQGSTLRVVAEHVEGLRLPDFLQEAVKGNTPLPQPAVLELAGRILRIAASLHQLAGAYHGAITPAHVVITRTAGVVLTDAVFGPALERLQRNREQLWREFRLAFPSSATLPRFDQRADVAQIGATVLAIALGRPLRVSEYPRSINEVVIAATLAARPGETGTSASALRMWLQEALHLHPRATLSSAVQAEQSFAPMLGAAAVRRGGAAALEHTVRRIFGDTRAAVEAAGLAAAWSKHPASAIPAARRSAPSPEHAPLPAPPPPAARPLPFTSILKSIFSRAT